MAIPALLAIVAITISAIWFFNRQAKIRWAKDQGIPEINRFIEDLNYAAAFHLVEKVEKYIPREQRLIALLPTIERYLSFQTNPKGANVYRYDEIDSDWKYLGLSPIDKVRTSRGYKRWKIEMEGFETVEGAVLTSLISVIEINLKLDKKGSLPPGMVRMYGGEYTLNIPGLDHLPPMQLDDYLIDKYEVNNKEFKNFVENGGYEKRDYWKHPFIKNGHVLTWEEAMAEFKDKTGRTGPAAWETGDYPNGLDDYPVSGISWYEAAAYAEFARKSLPSIYHWNVAASTQSTPFIVPFSNFNDQGPAPVGEYKGMSPFGTYDMAGNVREWCFNASENKRFILGGGWNDQTYMFNDAFSQPPFDRSMTNGFRCIKYLEEEKNLEALNKPLEFPYRDFMKEKPVSDEIFQIYLNMYAYDKTNLNAEVESVDESAEDWIKEKISFDAAYGNERIIAYLFLPKTGFPPYQTIVFFPGSNAIHAGSSERFSSRRERNIDFILKTGRAVIFPIYKGTYERKGDFNSDYPAETNTYKEYLIMQVKDFARSIDYLETRKDIDTDKLAYYGVSWGGAMGAIIPAVENRLKVSILYIAGLTFQKTLPEVDAINYITRVKIPVLMLNGRYDHFFPLESSQKPMFDLLGTPLEHKRPVIYETGHTVPRNQLIKETLAWLDRYLGPVK